MPLPPSVRACVCECARESVRGGRDKRAYVCSCVHTGMHNFDCVLVMMSTCILQWRKKNLRTQQTPENMSAQGRCPCVCFCLDLDPNRRARNGHYFCPRSSEDVHDCGGRDQAAAHRERSRSAIPCVGTVNMPKVGVLAGDSNMSSQRSKWVDISWKRLGKLPVVYSLWSTNGIFWSRVR